MFKTRCFIFLALAASLQNITACNEDPTKQKVDNRIISKPGAPSDSKADTATEPTPQSNDAAGVVEQSFEVTKKESSEESFTFENGFLNQELTLVESYSEKIQNFDQVDRLKVTDNFTQAAIEKSFTDSFTEAGNKFQYSLSAVPNNGILGVTLKYDGVVQAAGSNSVLGSSIYLNPVPANGTKIEVSYKSDLNSNLSFTLSKEPALDTVVVKVNNALRSANEYTVDGTAKTVSFLVAPAVGAKVEVSYRENMSLKKSFDVGAKLKADSLKVKVNNVDANFTYDAPKGLITIDPIPADAAKIIVIALFDEGPKLVYELTKLGTDPRAFSAKDKSSGAAIDVTYMDGKATFTVDGFKDGRVVVLSYKDITTITKELVLAHLPLAETVRVVTSAETCINGAGLSVVESKVFIECEMEKASDFKITYDYRGEPNSSFNLDMALDPDTGLWEVFINDQPTGAFTRKGTNVTLNSAPAADAVVKIRFTPSIRIRAR